ncbi:hypothetical protein Ciccas_009439, partial [Cichlidogyrus casuarinus]
MNPANCHVALPHCRRKKSYSSAMDSQNGTPSASPQNSPLLYTKTQAAQAPLSPSGYQQQSRQHQKASGPAQKIPL